MMISAARTHHPDAWETLWAPYGETVYAQVLAALGPEDFVLDLGAGDLRLALRMAEKARCVLAVERREPLLRRGRLAAGRQFPENLLLVCADAAALQFPPRLSAAVLLMRHCTQFELYRTKLVAAGCRRLITNTRWRMGLEIIDLTLPPSPFASVRIGWYACTCGDTGFIPGPAARLTDRVLEACTEVFGRPKCI